MISHDQVRSTLAQEPMTALFMDREGGFVKMLPVPEKPAPELVLELTQSHPDFAMVLRPKGEYSVAELLRWQRETVEGFEVFESGKLPPGWRHL
jgi:hypothetical protein